MSWEESIAAFDDREKAREKFHDWCEMKASVHDEITFDGRQNDVARLHVITEGNWLVRDLTAKYSRGSKPIRVIDVNAVDGDTVELQVLLAELESD